MENSVKAKGIDYLFHFTRIENLESILQNGLIPRSMLEAQEASVRFNDQHRIDGHKDANCLSIGHPNYKMFYSLRQDDALQEWVVIVINPEVLWLKDCAFCYENAASTNVTSIPIAQRKGLAAFETLFTPMVGKPDRATLRLPDDCPTHPQAEVLVFDIIEPQHIAGTVVNSKATETALKAQHSDFDFLYHRALYSARLDYEHW